MFTKSPPITNELSRFNLRKTFVDSFEVDKFIDLQMPLAVPKLASTPPNLLFVVGETATYDLSTHFAGVNIQYTLVQAPANVSVNINTGILTINTAAKIDESAIIVRATNLAGFVDGSFFVEVWEPQSLFVGVNGALYVPDQEYVYGDNYPVPYGNALNLLNDSSKLIEFGNELVPNSNFDTNLSWNIGTNVSIVGGNLIFNNVSAGNGASNILLENLSINNYYELTLNILSYSGGTTFVRISRPGLADIQFTFSSIGIKKVQFKPTIIGITNIAIFASGNGGNVTATFDYLSLKKIISNNLPSIQYSNSNARPLLGQAPKDRRNLARDTDNLGGTNWGNVQGISTVINNAFTGADGTVYQKIVPAATTAVHGRRQSNSSFVFGQTYTISQKARISESGVNLELFAFTGAGHNAVFNLTTGVVSSTLRSTATISGPDIDGAYLCSMTFTALSTIANNIDVRLTRATITEQNFVGDGTTGILVARHQWEVGSVATPYQQIIGNGLEIVEVGVPSYPFIRFDRNDDALVTTLNSNINGKVVVAGRNGSYIENVSLASEPNFQIGVTSYTGGTPNILSALGDIVGYSLIDKNLTTEEEDLLLRYYKARGAKGRLVANGPELITNGNFSNGSTGWNLPALASVFDGQLQITTNSGTDVNVSQSINVIANRPYQFFFEKISGIALYGDPDWAVVLNTLGITNLRFGLRPPGVYGAVFVPNITGAISIQIGNYADGSFAPSGSQTVIVDNISVKELRPEEEW